MDPNREHLKQVVDKNRSEFSFWGWVLRLVSLCVAFGLVIYYLANNNGPTDPYEDSSLFEEALFGDDEEDAAAAAEEVDGDAKKDSPALNSHTDNAESVESDGGGNGDASKTEEESPSQKRPEIKIPAFRSDKGSDQ